MFSYYYYSKYIRGSQKVHTQSVNNTDNNNKKHPNQFKCQQQLSPSLVYFMTPDQCEGRLTAPVPYNVTLGSVQV